MSVAVCRSSAASGFESMMSLPAAANFSAAVQQSDLKQSPPPQQGMVSDQNKYNQEAEKRPGQCSIQAKKGDGKKEEEVVYVHPLMRRSSSLLGQKSLELCTENLGSETGSDLFVSDDEKEFFFHSKRQEKFSVNTEPEQYQEEDNSVEEEEEAAFEFRAENEKKQQVTFNYHCSISSRWSSSPPRSFPPPLPSISRRNGPCLQMRPHRRDGRLVVKAVAVPSQNYLHAERQGGRLLLSFINTTSSSNIVTATEQQEEQLLNQELLMQEESIEEEEEITEDQEEEEVQVVDRGTVIEVKVSTQPQQSIGRPAAMKVHRSSIVINKFVSCLLPIIHNNSNNAAAEAEHLQHHQQVPPGVRRVSASTTTTAAAAAVAASSVSSLSAMDGSHSSTNENKLVFTSKRRNREELLHDMRRCSQLRKPLFIWEPCCIATSSS